MVTGGISHERLVAATVATGVALTALAAYASLAWARTTWPNEALAPSDARIWWCAAVSGVTLALTARWLLLRLPTNPTGWWVAGAGVAMSGWIWGTFTWTTISPWLEHLLPPVAKAAIVVAVLRWPTGRLPARWTTTLERAVLCYVVVSWLPHFVGSPGYPAFLRGLPSRGDLVTHVLFFQVVLVLVCAVAPVVFMGAVHRCRGGMPASVQVTTAPAYLAAILLGITELFVFVSEVTGAPVAGGFERHSTLRALGHFVDVARFGIVALLLVWSEAMRRRGAATATAAPSRIELGPEHSADASTDVARILGDPTAGLELVGVGQHVLARGRAPATDHGGRSHIEIADRRGRVVALIDHDDGYMVNRATRDALMASIGLAVVRSARQQAAEQRLAELRDVQRRVLDAQDRARRRLERDLHDGVQQRLVALALDASLLARRDARQGVSVRERELLRANIAAAAAVIREQLRTATPGVIDRGLAAGLVALDAAIPISTTLSLEGDVEADHPAAIALWFIASEAVANSLKHADATTITVMLEVDRDVAHLTVADDGRGGVAAPPVSIVDRLEPLPSTLDLTSVPGEGTSIHVTIELQAMVPA
jgi:signal transduction histidine kinase